MTDEYWEGYHDYKAGFTDNPYPLLSRPWYDWDAGWEDAEAEDY